MLSISAYGLFTLALALVGLDAYVRLTHFTTWQRLLCHLISNSVLASSEDRTKLVYPFNYVWGVLHKKKLIDLFFTANQPYDYLKPENILYCNHFLK